eukprot:XP_001701279.1 flagellar associated protein [Chlamydomonas reinhardtii]
MATSTLAPRFIFGFRADVKDNVHYAEDGSVVYPAGHNIVLYSPDTRTQRLIPGTLESEGITAICVSANKKLMAVAERSDKAMISVYDMQTLKRRKVLVSTDAGSKEYVSLSFSGDGKTLIAQGGAPEWNLVLWVWEKSKVGSVVKTTNQQGVPMFGCAFSPGDSALVSVIGQGIFKLFRNADAGLKAVNPVMGKRDPGLASCQCWVPDPPGSNEQRERLLLGMSDGEVLLLEGTDMKAAFSCDNGLPAVSIAAYSKGFVVGQDGGVVTIFERDEKEFYRRARAFTIEGNACKVLNLAISPNEEHLVASLENNQAFTLLLSNQEIMKQDEMNFEVLGTPNHAGPITGLDVCVRKALIASCCSTDRSVRLWNWADRTCELYRTFADEIFSIAIHPTGLQVLVGFADKLRLMAVLMEDLKVVKELGIKGCRECCFSTGGQYFAAVNGTTISIYNTYTCENVGNLRGHNGKVRSVAWSPDDSKLISAGMDGAVYEWRLKDLKRDKEHVLKGCAYASVLATPDCKLLYATGTDKKIKEFEDSTGTGTTISKEIDTGGVNLTQLALLPNARVMFAATEAGGVRTYKYPLTGEFQEAKCHAAPVSRLRVSWDESLLVSGGEDGSVFVWEEKLEYAVEVLVTRSELDEKRSRMSELEQQVAELTMQTEYQLRLKDLHLQERVKELTDKFSGESEADRQKFEALLAEKNEMEMEYEDKLKQAEERSQAQLQALDTQYQAKIMAEVERYQALMQEKELLAERWDEQNSLLVESHERVHCGADRGLRGQAGGGGAQDRGAAGGEGRAGARVRGDQEAAGGGRRPRDRGDQGEVRAKAADGARDQPAAQGRERHHAQEVQQPAEGHRGVQHADQGAVRAEEGAVRHHCQPGEGHCQPQARDPRARRDHRRQGAAHLRPQEEEPGAREVQVRPGLQDQGAEEADRAQGPRDQRDEGADQGDGRRAGAVPQDQRQPGPHHLQHAPQAGGPRQRGHGPTAREAGRLRAHAPLPARPARGGGLPAGAQGAQGEGEHGPDQGDQRAAARDQGTQGCGPGRDDDEGGSHQAAGGHGGAAPHQPRAPAAHGGLQRGAAAAAAALRPSPAARPPRHPAPARHLS